MRAQHAPHSIEGLIQTLDAAVASNCDSERCAAIKDALTQAATGNAAWLGTDLLRPDQMRYARRLLHKDPAGRYSVVVMVWNGEQGTPLHDHGGRWCVECVFEGRIRVRSFSRKSDLDSVYGLLDFRQETELITGRGEAGTLIPPFDYHILQNPDTTPAVTVHVYGGELLACNNFEPQPGGGYRASVATMCYTP